MAAQSRHVSSWSVVDGDAPHVVHVRASGVAELMWRGLRWRVAVWRTLEHEGRAVADLCAREAKRRETRSRGTSDDGIGKSKARLA